MRFPPSTAAIAWAAWSTLSAAARPTCHRGFYGVVEGGFGNQSQGVGQLETAARFGSSEAFLNANTQSNARGLDAPTFDAIHDNSSQSDQFFRFITQLTPRSTLAFDYSNQLAQFQIPINTDPNNPYDPIFTPAGTDDVQREYDRFSNLNYTLTSKDGNGVVQVIPWWRSTRINYDGDLPNDVLGITPNFGADARCANCAAPDDGSGSGSGQLHNVGLLSNTYANYIGLRLSDFRATKNHAWKVGLDVNRENLVATQAFACYYAEGCGATSGTHDQPYYLTAPPDAGPGRFADRHLRPRQLARLELRASSTTACATITRPATRAAGCSARASA